MSSFTIQKGTGVFYLPLEFQLEHGGVLVASQLAFERTGPEDAPVIVVLGGISAGMDVVGWWSDIVGPELAIDTSTHCVLGIDFLGGAGVSTGPSNWQGEGSFPLITSRDQALDFEVALTDSRAAVKRVRISYALPDGNGREEEVEFTLVSFESEDVTDE